MKKIVSLLFVVGSLFLFACSVPAGSENTSQPAHVQATLEPTPEVTSDYPCAFEAYTVGGGTYASIDEAPPVTFNIIAPSEVSIVFVTEGFRNSVEHETIYGVCMRTWVYVPQKADGRVTVDFLVVKSITQGGVEQEHWIPTDLITIDQNLVPSPIIP